MHHGIAGIVLNGAGISTAGSRRAIRSPSKGLMVLGKAETYPQLVGFRQAWVHGEWCG